LDLVHGVATQLEIGPGDGQVFFGKEGVEVKAGYVEGYVVLGLLDVFFGGTDIGVRLFDAVVDGKAIEQGHAGIKSYPVVEKGLGGKGVGGRIDGSTKVPEHIGASTQVGVTLVFGLLGVDLSALQVEFGSLDAEIVFDGGINALSQWPNFLSISRPGH